VNAYAIDDFAYNIGVGLVRRPAARRDDGDLMAAGYQSGRNFVGRSYGPAKLPRRRIQRRDV
jgi:hypothetical protein